MGQDGGLESRVNLKKPNFKLKHKIITGDRFSNNRSSDQCGCRQRQSSGREKSFAHRASVKAVARKPMPVIQWVAGYWIQPIGGSYGRRP